MKYVKKRRRQSGCEKVHAYWERERERERDEWMIDNKNKFLMDVWFGTFWKLSDNAEMRNYCKKLSESKLRKTFFEATIKFREKIFTTQLPSRFG